MSRHTIQLSEDQNRLAKECMRRERYRSLSELFHSFLRHWGLSQQPHHLTGEWAALDGHERDKIDAEILALVLSGKNSKGSWLKAMIYDCIKELNGPDAQTPRVDEVLRKLPETIKHHLAD